MLSWAPRQTPRLKSSNHCGATSWSPLERLKNRDEPGSSAEDADGIAAHGHVVAVMAARRRPSRTLLRESDAGLWKSSIAVEALASLYGRSGHRATVVVHDIGGSIV